MMQGITQTNSLVSKMLERSAVLLAMKSQNLDIQWIKEFNLQQIMNGCNRISTYLANAQVIPQKIQRELIQNPSFAAYYAKLIPMFPEEPPAEPDTKISSVRGYGHSGYSHLPVRQARRSQRTVLMHRLSELLELCWANELDISTFPVCELMEVLGLDSIDTEARLVYLANFSLQQQTEEQKQTRIRSLSNCSELPLRLDDWQKELIDKPYLAAVTLFSTAKFEEACQFLQDNPDILDIIELFFTREIEVQLTLEDYVRFTEDTDERIRLLTSVADHLGADNTSNFISFWEKSHFMLDELRRLTHQITVCSDRDWDSLFFSYSGYVNLLYGTQLKEIDLSTVQSYHEDILTYAIIHRKKHFLKLVDANAEKFLCLPRDCILLQKQLYEDHFNLNELTEKNMDACRWMKVINFDLDNLMPGRQYTFPELAALYGVSHIYISCYHLLQSDSQDYRLKVFRQLCKRNALKPTMGPDDLLRLAEKLNIKPLQDWREQEFGDIPELTAEDTTQLLIHYKAIAPLLPDIRCRMDVILLLKNLAVLDQIDSIKDLKKNIRKFDAEWHSLAEEMELSEEFQNQHQETIIRFLCRNGAYIARTYAKDLDRDQCESFYRVVKAELMGQLHVLKYFEGDLQCELDASLTEQIKAGWSKNNSLTRDRMEVRECDDFFSTMLLGTQPHDTCLSYVNGVYKHCLLSAFDSNKKILYVSLNERIVARAFLRLTKGRLTGATAKKGKDNFTFVDLENIDTMRQEEQAAHEELTLFLERPYISGVSPAHEEQIHRLLIELACKKADELGTMLVLSMSYSPPDQTFTQTRFDIYISASKAGAQYLDSLDGQATVVAERSYKANSFMVREHSPMRKT